ncbi:MAG: tRNA (N6-isopentenyl adenosine(37)-C2)-methylthiotransferase MiaB [Deltaproteobacteria bacterium]|nr:tRNA (N6-isopentenyl adenosine(37)-C2)-methylthiotransferase MiaB [Deltaproteobacteria bacterium]
MILFKKSVKRLHIQTYGCQMNEHDTLRMSDLLARRGYTRTDSAADADVIIINTCSVREKPVQKLLSDLGRLRCLKTERPGLVIGVTGCIAQQEGERLLKRVPHLDLVVGPDNLREIADVVERIRETGGRFARAKFLPRAESISRFEYDSWAVEAQGEVSRLVPIMKGCDKVCAFCIVPYVRGPEVSRPSEDIVAEIARLAAAGVREVTLVGQNVNSFGKDRVRDGADEVDFAGLLEAVDRVPGIERIRFTTSHPEDLSDRLIDALARLDNVCEHLHLPVQSGSDRVLERMRRGYTRSEYLGRVAKLRERVPCIALTTDIIVGHPGETDADFDATLSLLDEVRFANIFSFCYSPRPRTASARMTETVDRATAARRLAIVQSLQRELTWSAHRALVGNEVEVLVEGPSRRGGHEMMGRTRSNVIVNFVGELGAERGQLVSVRVAVASPNTLSGVLVSCEEPDGERESLRGRDGATPAWPLKVLSDAEASCQAF